MDNDGTPPRLDSTVINRQYPDYVYRKVVVSNNILEDFNFDEPIRINGGVKNNQHTKRGENSRGEEYCGRSVHKARNTIRRLAQCNFNEDDKFLTLTLNNDNDFNIESIKECDAEFRLFIRALRRRFRELKYIAVREFQKRGAVHYHILTNFPYIPKQELAEIWGHGFVQINAVTNVFGIGAYISKYLSKEFGGTRFKGVKTYITSRNLERPTFYYGDDADEIYKELVKQSEMPSFENTFKSKYNGFVYFSEYNLTQLPARESKK